MKYTSNLNLKLPEGTDLVDIKDFTDNFEALDTAVASKADGSSFSSHTGNTTIHITASERNSWNSKAEGSHNHDSVYLKQSEVVTTASANKILKLNSSGKLPASITGDADTVDGKHASDFATANHTHSQLHTHSSSLANIDDAVNKRHSQNTDSVITSGGATTANTTGTGNIIDFKVSGTTKASVTNAGVFTGTVAWGNVSGKPSTFTPASHNHDERYYTQSQLSTSGGGGAVHWNNVTSKPTSFTPASHNHSAGNITSGILGIARGGTNNSSYTSSQFLLYDGTKIASSGYTASSFASASHSHAWSAITGKPSTFTPSSHSHSASDLPSASTSSAGIVQLNNTVTSTSTTQGATANAVKMAYDKANHSHPYASSSHNHDSSYAIKSGFQRITVSATAPSSPSAGDIWIDIS